MRSLTSTPWFRDLTTDQMLEYLDALGTLAETAAPQDQWLELQMKWCKIAGYGEGTTT